MKKFLCIKDSIYGLKKGKYYRCNTNTHPYIYIELIDDSRDSIYIDNDSFNECLTKDISIIREFKLNNILS